MITRRNIALALVFARLAIGWALWQHTTLLTSVHFCHSWASATYSAS